MDIDESGWRDLQERLARSRHGEAEIAVLQKHLADRLVSHFGVERMECWLGKDGARHHSMQEVAAAALAHLLPVLNQVSTETVAELINSDQIGAPMPPPWDDHWRTQARTAGWRS